LTGRTGNIHLQLWSKVKVVRIGELARRTGLSTSKIRFYEARGLLPAAVRSANGYRDYGEHALSLVTFIDRAQSLGFTLREVAAHLSSPEGEGRKARLQARLEAKLAEMNALMEQMRSRRTLLLQLVDEIREAARASVEQARDSGSPSSTLD